jgi:hypothetical protein
MNAVYKLALRRNTGSQLHILFNPKILAIKCLDNLTHHGIISYPEIVTCIVCKMHTLIQ